MKKNSLLLYIFLYPFIFAFAQSYDIPAIPADNNSTLCQNFFQNLTEALYQGLNLSNLSPEITNLYQFSGHNLNDLGMYKSCQDLSTQKYSLVTIDGFLIGFCGPSYCSVDQLQNLSNTMVSVLSKLTKRNLSDLDMTFIDPTQTGLESDFWFYFAIFVYVLLFGLVMVGTILAMMRKNNQKKQAKHHQDDLLINRESSNDTVIHRLVKPSLEENTTDNNYLRRIPLHIKIIECFDIAHNFKDLFKNEEVPGHDQNLNVFSGIRTLAFGWVVYGHTFMSGEHSKNIMYAELFRYQSAWSLITFGAFYAVDTFFYLSGFFTGFILVSKLKRLKISLKNYTMLLFHRWIRLWPAYFFAILFYWKISVYLGSGPVWWSYVASTKYCDTGVWKNLLFLDNVLNAKYSYYCFGWGWYLSCDFQMFLLAPFICWLYLKNRGRSQLVIWILMSISFLAAYGFSTDVGYTSVYLDSSNNGDSYMLEYYINTLVRMSPYLLGLWIGIVFKEYKQGEVNFFSKLRDSKVRSLVCCLVGFGLLVFIIFYPRMLQTGGTWTDGFGQTWSTLSRPGWALGVFLLTAPCLVGNLKDLGKVLGNFYFTLVAKVSYTAYLIHLVFLSMIFTNVDQLWGLSQAVQTSLAFAIMITGIVGGITIHLIVEKPIINIEMRILSANRGKKPMPEGKNVKTVEV